MPAYTIYGASAQLGYGVSEPSLRYVVDEYDVDAIAADAGSNDPGPYYYGAGEFFASVDTIKRDFRLLLQERDRLDVPLVVANVATGGTATHLDRVGKLIEEIADEEGLSFELSKIYTDVEKSLLKDRLASGDVRNLDGLDEELTPEMVDRTTELVASMGHEPYLDALATGSDVIIGGRSLDIAPYVALAKREGFPEDLVFHFGKLLECAGTAAEAKPGEEDIIGRAGLVGKITDDYFELSPANPNERCTVRGAAIQTMHEKADPFTIYTPSGVTDISDAVYEQRGDRLRISGGEFTPNDEYSLLVEGVEQVGYRTIAPIYIADRAVADNLEHIVERTHENVRKLTDHPEERYTLLLRKMGDDVREDASLFRANDGEVLRDMGMGIIIDVVGDTQAISESVCSLFKSKFKSLEFEGRVNVGGNMLIPYSQSELTMGPEYTFSIYHLVEGVQPDEIAETQSTVIA